LNHLLKYQKALVVVLMALYAFITTPAQMWHSHTYAAAGAFASTVEEGRQGIPLLSEDSLDIHCGICAHHYSIYIAETPSCIEELLINHTLPGQEFLCSITTIPNPVFCNKGPPRVC